MRLCWREHYLSTCFLKKNSLSPLNIKRVIIKLILKISGINFLGTSVKLLSCECNSTLSQATDWCHHTSSGIKTRIHNILRIIPRRVFLLGWAGRGKGCEAGVGRVRRPAVSAWTSQWPPGLLARLVGHRGVPLTGTCQTSQQAPCKGNIEYEIQRTWRWLNHGNAKEK